MRRSNKRRMGRQGSAPQGGNNGIRRIWKVSFMSMQDILIAIQYTSITLILFMSVYITRIWKKPLHGWLFFYSIATLINNMGFLMLMQSETESAAMRALQFCYLGRVWIPFALLNFVMILCDRKRPARVFDLLALIHATTFLLVLTVSYNKLYYISYSYTREGVFPHLTKQNGVWHYAYDALIASYVVYGFTLLYRLMRGTKNPTRKKQLGFIFAAILTDSVSFVLEMFHVIPGFDMTTMGYTLATLFLSFAIFRYDMLGTKELARDFVIDRMSEGVVITDENSAVVDYNQTAKAILPKLETEPQAALDEIVALAAESSSLNVEGRRYTPKENQLMDENHVRGKVYMLTDDTEHYRRAELLTREMMLALSKTVDAKDHYTNGHSTRVAKYAAEIARRMGKSQEEQEKIYEMGLLHDIGKIGVSEEIINKTSRLTDEEFAQIKQHTVIGCNILRQISVMPELADGARSHHERYDGRGYPDGLAGEAIPERARIICLADCYDAMTSTRTYSKPMAQQAVRAEIVRCSGTQFDPDIAQVMLSMIDDDTEYTMHE